MSQATLADVAKYAGISTAAASYYFRGKKKLSKISERKLEEGASILNYIPMHIRSKSDTDRNNRLINICINVENDDTRDDIYFFCIVNGVMDYLVKQNYQLTISRLVEGDPASDEIFFSGLRLANAVILCNPRNDHYIENELIKRKKPYVVLGSPEDTGSEFCVDVDIKGVGFQAADYLLKNGHQRILYLNLPQSLLQSQQRHEGFKLAYENRGLNFIEEDHVYAAISAEICCQVVTYLFSINKSYTAIVTSNEIQAQGVIKAMKELKIDIPSKLSLLSMGGTMLGTLTTPTLTTIDFNPHKKGFEAARLVLEILEGKRITPFSLILPGNLVERESTRSLSEL